MRRNHLTSRHGLVEAAAECVTCRKAGRNATAITAALVIAIAAPAAFAGASATPKLIGSATAGKPLFKTSCGTCHTLAAAGTAGTIGPNLTKTSLTEAVIIKAISDGGAAVMSGSQVAKYPTTMVAFKSVFTTKQIDNIAAFIYTSTHK